MSQNNNLMVRNLIVKDISKALIYFYSHSLGLLAKPGNKLPIMRINFPTLLLVVFFPLHLCWFQKLLSKKGQEDIKWLKFSHS